MLFKALCKNIQNTSCLFCNFTAINLIVHYWDSLLDEQKSDVLQRKIKKVWPAAIPLILQNKMCNQTEAT